MIIDRQSIFQDDDDLSLLMMVVSKLIGLGLVSGVVVFFYYVLKVWS